MEVTGTPRCCFWPLVAVGCASLAGMSRCPTVRSPARPCPCESLRSRPFPSRVAWSRALRGAGQGWDSGPCSPPPVSACPRLWGLPTGDADSSPCQGRWASLEAVH